MTLEEQQRSDLLALLHSMAASQKHIAENTEAIRVELKKKRYDDAARHKQRWGELP